MCAGLYLHDAAQVLHVGALCVQDLLHHAVHIRPGPLPGTRPLSYVRTEVRFRVSGGALPSPCVLFPRHATAAAAPPSTGIPSLPAGPLSIPLRVPAPQLAGRDQLQPDGPGVRVERRGGAGPQHHRAPDQGAVAVPRRGRRGRGAVADGPLGAVRGGVHAVGGAVAQRHVAGDGVAQRHARHRRDFWERRQRVSRVVVVIWEGDRQR